MILITDNIQPGKPFFDRRARLIPCQKLKVRWLYNRGFMSISELADLFHVDMGVMRRIIYTKTNTSLKTRSKNESGIHT